MTVRLPSSFRDPSGFLYEREGILYRQVERRFAATYDAFVSSGAYGALVEAGVLVEHDEVGAEHAATPDAARVLRPRRLPTISYPYEWCPAQLRDAALLTLRAQSIALDHGFTLRDASAYNVAFDRGRAVFIDTLSFAPRVEGEPWVAYGQFCRHFLAPLALTTLVDPRLSRLLTTHIDGVPLDLAATLLPARSKLKPGLGVHLHGQARASGGPVDPDADRRTARFSERAMRGLVESLRGTVRKLTWEPSGTWTDYYDEADHYTAAAMASKIASVTSLLETSLAEAPDRASPTVWDLGANTGRFSRLAADLGAHVVAWDIDHGAVQRAWADVRGGDVDLLPLVLDLANPSPGIGWANRERPAFAERGPVDTVLALGLLHHLAIGNNVPPPSIAAFLAGLAREAIVEWIPKDDVKVRTLLATREDVFDDYTPDGWLAALAPHFEILTTVPLEGSGRVLHHLRAR